MKDKNIEAWWTSWMKINKYIWNKVYFPNIYNHYVHDSVQNFRKTNSRTLHTVNAIIIINMYIINNSYWHT